MCGIWKYANTKLIKQSKPKIITTTTVWLFSSPARYTRVPPLVTCQSRASCEIQSRGPAWVHTLELFFTLSHTQPLHDSQLNIGFLNAKLQANWHRIMPTKWLIKFNLTIFNSFHWFWSLDYVFGGFMLIVGIFSNGSWKTYFLSFFFIGFFF